MVEISQTVLKNRNRDDIAKSTVSWQYQCGEKFEFVKLCGTKINENGAMVLNIASTMQCNESIWNGFWFPFKLTWFRINESVTKSIILLLTGNLALISYL